MSTTYTRQDGKLAIKGKNLKLAKQIAKEYLAVRIMDGYRVEGDIVLQEGEHEFLATKVFDLETGQYLDLDPFWRFCSLHNIMMGEH